MTTTPHDEFDELLALRALGTLDGDDARRLDAHLAAGCATCARELAELEQTAALVAWSAGPQTPPLSLRGRVLAAVAEVAEAEARTPIPFRPRQPRPRLGSVAAAVALLAAACVAIAVLTSWLISARSQLDDAVRQLADVRASEKQKDERLARQERMLDVVNDPEVKFVRLSSTAAPSEPSVDVAWNPRQQRGVLNARGLARIGADKAYELWLIADGTPVPAAVFNTDAGGNALIEIERLTPPGAPQVFAVTVEPAGGSPAPTTKPILAGSYGA